jgi:SulP family sulfate permease
MTSLSVTLRGLLPQRSDYTNMSRAPRTDLLAGLTVAIVALPLALGYGAASGMSPVAGLTTAIVAGFIAAIFGGSSYQVSGPTGAMTVVLIPIVAGYGPSGVLMVAALAGVVLVLLALLGIGRFTRYIPVPVIEGFTLGIAIVIFLQQLPAAIGVDSAPHHVAVAAGQAILTFAEHPQWSDIALGCGVAAVMLVGGRWRPTLPFSLIAIALATAVTGYLRLDVPLIGTLPKTLPAPSIAFFDPATVWELLGPAVAVALMSTLETLLAATVADHMRGEERHQPDRELLGQGLANLVSPLFGGMPASAAITRTTVNVRCGARSRLAALSHAVILGLFMLVAAPLVGLIPLAALAGVLLATTVGMVNRANLAALAKATKSDGVVMALTTIATVALDLVMGILVGLAIAATVALVKVAASLRVHRTRAVATEQVDGRGGDIVEHIEVYRLQGPLFFAAGRDPLLRLGDTAAAQAIVLHLADVTTVDASGALALREATDQLRRRDIPVYVCGVPPEHHGTLNAVGALEYAQDDRLHDSVEEAVAAARDRLRLADPSGP